MLGRKTDHNNNKQIDARRNKSSCITKKGITEIGRKPQPNILQRKNFHIALMLFMPIKKLHNGSKSL